LGQTEVDRMKSSSANLTDEKQEAYVPIYNKSYCNFIRNLPKQCILVIRVVCKVHMFIIFQEWETCIVILLIHINLISPDRCCNSLLWILVNVSDIHPLLMFIK